MLSISNMSKQTEIVRKYLSMVESMSFTPEQYLDLLHPDYQQWELPNLLNKNGQKSDLADSEKRMKIAKSILTTQRYEITSMIEQNATVVMEAVWNGTMATDAGALKKGQILKAYFCMVFDFMDGKIHRIRNYDCFEPFA